MSMNIYVQTTDKEWTPGKILIPEEHSNYLGEFAHFMAEEMAQLVKDAIEDQRFAHRWPPLSMAWYRKKKKNNWSLKMWKATGMLQRSIEAYRSNDKWVVGINQYKTYPNSTIRIYQVARALEYGTDKIPPRPLFRPIKTHMSKHSGRYWEKFKKMKNID